MIPNVCLLFKETKYGFHALFKDKTFRTRFPRHRFPYLAWMPHLVDIVRGKKKVNLCKWIKLGEDKERVRRV